MAVFIAGLMVGRTPEYLGKKIEAFEMKMAIAHPLMPLLVLRHGRRRDARRTGAPHRQPGAARLLEILYAFSSAANNNGSAVRRAVGQHARSTTRAGGAMMARPLRVIVPVLAIAGRLAALRASP